MGVDRIGCRVDPLSGRGEHERTTSEPGTFRSRSCTTCRCTRSRSTARSWARSGPAVDGRRSSRRSSTWLRRWGSRSWARASRLDAGERAPAARLPRRAGLLLRAAALFVGCGRSARSRAPADLSAGERQPPRRGRVAIRGQDVRAGHARPPGATESFTYRNTRVHGASTPWETCRSSDFPATTTAAKVRTSSPSAQTAGRCSSPIAG